MITFWLLPLIAYSDGCSYFSCLILVAESVAEATQLKEVPENWLTTQLMVRLVSSQVQRVII